jgi:integrase
MPKRVLTDRFIAHAKAAPGEVQTDYYDTGSPGLALRVSGRSKTWTYFFTIGGKRHRLRLGTYPATSLARAHTLADTAKADLEKGNDPRTALAAPETLRAICEEWAEREAAGLRTGEARKSTLERLVYPVLGARPIADIRRSEIVRLLDGIEDAQGPAAADKTLAFIRRVFNWHASRSDDFRSPIVRGMARTKPRERARARILSDDEIRVVWRVAEGQGAFGKLVQFLLLTSARRTEAAAMPWAELEGSEWLLPARRNKTKLDLLRPLPPMALDVIGTKSNGAVFVFSNDAGANALCGYGPLKKAFDAAVTKHLVAASMPSWRLHDLRRTARSLMSRAGVPSDYAERCLGHVIGGIRGTYDRFEYRDEKAEAFTKLARLLDRILSGKPTVVTLQRVMREADANG